MRVLLVLCLALLASPAHAFCSIAAGCAPSGVGVLAVDYTSGEGQPFTVYLHGRDFELDAGVAGTPLELPTGVFDVVLHTQPPIREVVEILAGETTTVSLGGAGQVIASGLDVDGAPLDVDVVAFPATGEGSHGGDAIAVADTGTPLELPAGEYDIRIDTTPPVWHLDASLRSGAPLEYTLPQTGGIAFDYPEGQDYYTYFVYPQDGSDDLLGSGYTNEILGIVLPGTYQVYVDSDPDEIFEGVEVSSGAVTRLALAERGGIRIHWNGAPALRELVILSLAYVRSPGEDGGIVSSVPVGEVAELPSGTYDVDMNLWFDYVVEGVVVDAPEITELEVPPLGGVDFNYDPDVEAPLSVYTCFYAPDAEAAIFCDYDAYFGVLLPPGTYRMTIDPGGDPPETEDRITIREDEVTEFVYRVKAP